MGQSILKSQVINTCHVFDYYSASTPAAYIRTEIIHFHWIYDFFKWDVSVVRRRLWLDAVVDIYHWEAPVLGTNFMVISVYLTPIHLFWIL